MEIVFWIVAIAVIGFMLFGWFMFCKNHPILGSIIALLMLSGE